MSCVVVGNQTQLKLKEQEEGEHYILFNASIVPEICFPAKEHSIVGNLHCSFELS